MAIEATRQAREVSGFQAALDKIGATGAARVTAIETFLDSVGASIMKGRIYTAQDVASFERIATSAVAVVT